MTWLNSGGQRSRSQQAVELVKASTSTIVDLHLLVKYTLAEMCPGRGIIASEFYLLPVHWLKTEVPHRRLATCYLGSTSRSRPWKHKTEITRNRLLVFVSFCCTHAYTDAYIYRAGLRRLWMSIMSILVKYREFFALAYLCNRLLKMKLF